MMPSQLKKKQVYEPKNITLSFIAYYDLQKCVGIKNIEN